MTKEEMGAEAYASLLDSIVRIMLRNGIKATTMDYLASRLQMSKRTLYEIFTDKREMVGEVLRQFHIRQAQMHSRLASESANEAEAMMAIFLRSREMIANMNVDFYNDMDQFYNSENLVSREEQFNYMQNMVNIIKSGQKKGYFRDDMNYVLAFRMMVLQMESLKKVEETFPKDIKLLDVYDAIMMSFMRGISTVKGLEVVDNLLHTHLNRSETGIKHSTLHNPIQRQDTNNPQHNET